MSKKALTGLSAAMLGAEEPARPMPIAVPAAIPEPIALTVKVNQAVYQRLKALGAQRRQSNQAILSAALVEYLDRQA